jgi:hypothetical protein
MMPVRAAGLVLHRGLVLHSGLVLHRVGQHRWRRAPGLWHQAPVWATVPARHASVCSQAR